MKPLTKLVIFFALIIVIVSGIFIFTTNNTDKLVGGQTDNNECLVAAGYSWCESKSKCLRIFEEFCPDEVTKVIEDLNIKTGNELVLKGNKPFTWIVGEGDVTTDVALEGVSYETKLAGMDEFLKLEQYMDSTYEPNTFTNADGFAGAVRGYFVDYMACSLNYRYPFATGNTEETMQPQSEELIAFLECGYFNKNDIPKLVAAQIIKEILANKHNKDIKKVKVEITKFTGDYAAGKVTFSEEKTVESGLILARKTDGKWVISYEGNGSIDCQDLENNQGYPEEILKPEFCD